MLSTDSTPRPASRSTANGEIGTITLPPSGSQGQWRVAGCRMDGPCAPHRTGRAAPTPWPPVEFARAGDGPGIAAVALAYRLIFVPAVPSLSDDFFRYVWDGHVQRQGYSPYRSPPDAPEVAPLRDGYYWPKINRKGQTSAYPPLAELVFEALF